MSTLYHAYVNGTQLGPLKKEELLSSGVTEETLVWHPGLSGWVAAREVDELADLFSPKATTPGIETPEPPEVPPYSYFAHINGSQTGPFPATELAARGVTGDTPVWREGLPAWTAASNLPELNGFTAPSSPFDPRYTAQRPQYGQPQYPYGQPENTTQAPQNPYGPRQNPYGQPQYNPYVPADWTNWLPWAVVGAIFGFIFSCIGLVFGIIAINNANKANRLIRMGNEAEARAVNNSAKNMTIVSLVLGGIGLIATIGIFSSSHGMLGML